MNIRHTVNPPCRDIGVPAPSLPSHNETYLNAFIERCRLQGWTEAQIKTRVTAYLRK